MSRTRRSFVRCCSSAFVSLVVIGACANPTPPAAPFTPGPAPVAASPAPSVTTSAVAPKVEAEPVPAPDLPFVHPLFSDHMVLQRAIAAPVWGWTKPGTAVTVSIAGKTATATSGSDGRWLAHVGPIDAGGPYNLAIDGPTHVEIHDVLVGDVWLCSGQSNMGFTVAGANDSKNELAHSSDPELRLFSVPNRPSASPQSVVHATWFPSGPESARWFSAVGYFFGKELRSKLKVPIGLIHSSWGGTVAEAWTSEPALATLHDFQQRIADFHHQQEAIDSGRDSAFAAIDSWWRDHDPGSKDGWEKPAFDDAGWSTMPVPKAWEQAGLPDFDGVVWFRTTVDVSAADAGKPARLSLGPIDDEDVTWIDGRRLGHTEGWNLPRNYAVPAGVLSAGKHVIAVRVLDTGQAGGFHGQPGELELRITGGASISLAHDWRYRASTPLSKLDHRPPSPDSDPNRVTVLYNGMIAPLVPFGIKGAIWYQGEANAGRAAEYRHLLPTLIADWRKRFEVGDFPFGIVQLANWLAPQKDPSEGGWAEIRESQALTAQNVPNAGLAVAIDVGDAKDIHPKDKQTVSHRLALWALATTYGDKVEYSGPVYRSMEVKGKVAYLSFDHIGAGLLAKNGALRGFAIAGADGKFEWGNAKIEGNRVSVTAAKVPVPVVVRYDWANNPAGNLYNKDGLPAVPFRTDAPNFAQ